MVGKKMRQSDRRARGSNIYRGLKDLKEGDTPERVRNPGGGRKKLSEQHPALLHALEELIAPATRGDPESPLKWTCKSVRNLEEGLKESGHAISYRTVATMLHQLEYSLQSNRKTSEGKKDHPDRDEQFQCAFRSKVNTRIGPT